MYLFLFFYSYGGVDVEVTQEAAEVGLSSFRNGLRSAVDSWVAQGLL
jgi:hypothetical protein